MARVSMTHFSSPRIRVFTLMLPAKSMKQSAPFNRVSCPVGFEDRAKRSLTRDYP
jgi:hypothetical protein